MDTLKNLLIVALLAGVGFGVYRVVTREEDVPPQGANIATEAPLHMADVGKDPGSEMSADEAVNGSLGTPIVQNPSVPDIGTTANISPPNLHTDHSPSVSSRLGGRIPNQLDSPDVQIPNAEVAHHPTTGNVDNLSNKNIGNAASSLNPQEANPLPPANQNSGGSYAAALQQAQALLRQNKLTEAQLQLSTWYDHPSLKPQERQELIDLLGKLAGTCIYSNRSLLGKQHVVIQGENLQKIAAQYKVPWQMIAKINGLTNPTQLTPGTRLQVLEGPFHATVNLSENWIYLEYQKRYAGRFRILKTGRDAPKDQIIGQFVVTAKDNQQGEHYVSLNGRLGIHSTNTQGRSGRDGIILNSQDAEDLFDILSIGSRIVVIR